MSISGQKSPSAKQAEGWIFYLTYYRHMAQHEAEQFAWGIVRWDRERRGLPAEAANKETLFL